MTLFVVGGAGGSRFGKDVGMGGNERIVALEASDPRQVGRYRIVGRLGAGGMGRVYLGRSPGGRPVAVKVVRPELAEEPGFAKRFAREVTTARRVNGFFTAAVVDADPEGDPAWLATAYMPGPSVAEAVEAHGAWPAAAVRALGAGVVEALEDIHRVGLVHRDLKPSNVLLAADGPRVIDFGISLVSEASALTATGLTVGTPGFMSPEQLTSGSVGPPSDVFSLGALLAYVATGRGPFGEGSAHALLFRIVYEEPDLSGVPDSLSPLIAACLAKKPDDRPGLDALLQQLAFDEYDAAGWLPTAVAADLADRGEAHAAFPPLPATPPPPVTSARVPSPARPAPSPLPPVPASTPPQWPPTELDDPSVRRPRPVHSAPTSTAPPSSSRTTMAGAASAPGGSTGRLHALAPGLYCLLPAVAWLIGWKSKLYIDPDDPYALWSENTGITLVIALVGVALALHAETTARLLSPGQSRTLRILGWSLAVTVSVWVLKVLFLNMLALPLAIAILVATTTMRYRRRRRTRPVVR
ncbi:serine/threonine-protein kinase [Streptomyces sp. Amel2xC10]|uniref:serine/threonine-protein kinase n=1 Tax=Streptomyces sp. Amel2xC10 TaxID=1305826 RepID=UPI000A08ED30|nr:serine/threonine-protein kinase [Streptomyces sp. Amel2xC10]SMF78415.1 Serine/threonine protein kinase [Streptomyces sp. Amel2xC10]